MEEEIPHTPAQVEVIRQWQEMFGDALGRVTEHEIVSDGINTSERLVLEWLPRV